MSGGNDQSWRVRKPDAPLTTLTRLADKPPKKIGRPRKDDAEKTRLAKAAAQALVNAQIAKLQAERNGSEFTIEGAQEGVYSRSTDTALRASGAAVAHAPSGTPALNADPDQGAPAPVVVPEAPVARAVGGDLQGAQTTLPEGAARLADGTLVLFGAQALHHTELAPDPNGGVRVRTGTEQEESIIRYVYARMLNKTWTDEQCASLGKELHRAEHTIRMYANRAARRMAEPLSQTYVHEGIYRRARLVSDIALENYQAVHDPQYGAVAIRALEMEFKVSALLPKELPAPKTQGEMLAALDAARARVVAMGAPAEPEGVPDEYREG